MSPRARLVVLLTVIAAICCLPVAGAGAATSGSFDDEIGDSEEFAPDLGLTTVAIGDDETISVETRFEARPPAFWGGCAYYVVGTCIPADMTVTWYLDHTPGRGSLADRGADAKVVAIPRSGETTWEGSNWDAANGRFSAGAPPVADDDEGGARWTLRLTDLGIPRPSSLRIWAVSLYKSYNGLGVLLDYEDIAGPGTVPVEAAPAVVVPIAVSPSCRRKARAVNRAQRRLRTLRRRARRGNRRARRKLRATRAVRRRAVRAMKRRCGAPVKQEEPPAAAPPGCKLVTKPVLRQEGVGIHAEWVVKPEVVVECLK